jgi:hypothetical protein
MSLPAQIHTALTLSLVVPGDDPLPVDATLSYDAADPYAVHLDIAAGEGVVRWSFARELLTAGVDAPSGEGDVRIIPVAGRDGRRVRIQLSSPDGAAILEAPLTEMVEFLGATFDAVPTGTESDHFDVDALLAGLLAD